MTVIDIDHRSAVRNTFMVSRLAASVFDGDVIALARSDFNYLYLNSSFEGVSCLYGKVCSEKNEELKKSFLSQLILMGFNEIAKDIQDLLEGKENNAKRFSDKISQSIMDDSSLVKRMASGEQLEEINVVRVVFLGSGGAGKTSLVKALLGYEDFDRKDKELGSSHLSVDLQKMFPYLELSSDRKIEIFLWDFSGHAISYGLHTAFITENCVYVLVVDSRDEQSLDNWLYQIQYVKGGDTKVIVVTNWFEDCDTLQNQRYLIRKYSGLLDENSFFYFPIDDRLRDNSDEVSVVSFNKFVKTLWDFSLDSRRFSFARTLRAYEGVKSKYGGEFFIKRKLLVDAMRSYGETSEIIAQLEQLGFIVRVSKDERIYCLKPNWLLEYSRKLFYLDKLIENNGILSWSELLNAAVHEIDEDVLDRLVEFLIDQGLCHKLLSGDKEYYFFTYACNPNEPQSINVILSQKENKKLVVKFDLPYFPLGLHARLANALFRQGSDFGIKNFEYIWKDGFLIHNITSHSMSCGVVQFLKQKHIVELTLVGEFNGFAKILKVFYMELMKFLAVQKSIAVEDVHPFVVFGKDFIPIESGVLLVKAIEQIDGFDQLFSWIHAMQPKTGNINIGSLNVEGQSSVAVGEAITQKNIYTNFSIMLDAGQREIISTILNEMLRHKATLPDDALEAIYDVRKVVKADEKKPTEKTQSLLSRFFDMIKGVAGFTEDAGKIGIFVNNNLPLLASAATTVAALANQLPGF